MKTHDFDNTFKREVYDGLNGFPKTLPSKYFYDEAGDALFQQIMALPEYSLTQAEHEILSAHKAAIADLFAEGDHLFDLTELGPGDGKKTKVLLEHLAHSGRDFVYRPIDISENAVDKLLFTLKKELPTVRVQAETGDYFRILEKLKKHNARKKTIMFLGSNIGNLTEAEAIGFLTALKNSMQKRDMLLIGFDQKKDPQQILDAYNDQKGITDAFNLNILQRLNRELGADFKLEKFKHWEMYDPESGTAKSFLVATNAQEVNIAALNLKIKLEAWESIHTEISQKYDDKSVAMVAEKAGLIIKNQFGDSKGLYKNYVFIRNI